MTPIQIWLPTFFGGAARPELRRDMDRLFRMRTTEQVMWSVPDWSGPANWTQAQTRVSCLNGERLECVRILHVGENGAVIGPAAAGFPNMSIAGLLDAWLNNDFVRFIPRRPEEGLRVEVPYPVKGGIALVARELPLRAEHFLPITHAGDHYIAAQWPPRASMPQTVSPEQESVNPAAEGSIGPLSGRLAWLAPFDALQPLAISLDDVFARDKMREIAKISGKNYSSARAQAATESRDWISKGSATLNEVWLQPIIAEEGELGALYAIESRLGISADSLEQAYKNARAREQLSAAIPVTRAWGVPGLMWALLLDRLSRAEVHRVCRRCSALISGRGHKIFCSASDNPACFQARKAADRRRSRLRPARQIPSSGSS